MTEHPKQAGIEALREQHDLIQGALADFKHAGVAAMVEMAKMPEGRAKLVTARTQFGEWRLMLASSVRDLAEIDRMLNKALRKGAWRFRA